MKYDTNNFTRLSIYLHLSGRDAGILQHMTSLLLDIKLTRYFLGHGFLHWLGKGKSQLAVYTMALKKPVEYTEYSIREN